MRWVRWQVSEMDEMMDNGAYSQLDTQTCMGTGVRRSQESDPFSGLTTGPYA
jgi:hypothetical protein